MLTEGLTAAELEWITSTNEAQGNSRREMMLQQLEEIAQELIDANINDQAALDKHVAKGGGAIAGFVGIPGGKEIVKKMIENRLAGKKTTAKDIVTSLRNAGLKEVFGSVFGAPFWLAKMGGQGACSCGEWLMSGVCAGEEPTEEETEFLLPPEERSDPKKRKGLAQQLMKACTLTWLSGKGKKKIEISVKEPLPQSDLLGFFSTLENSIVNLESSRRFFFHVVITLAFAIVAVAWCFVKNKLRENSYTLLDDSEV